MEIRDIDNYTTQELRDLINSGQAKFVSYKYCISILVMTFNNPTDIYFIAPGQSDVIKGLRFLFVNLILGWWGIPWGPVYTIGNIFNILSGGKDVTDETMSYINNNDPSYGVGNTYNIPGSNSANNGLDQYNVPNN